MLKSLYIEKYGAEPTLIPLTPAGSNRQYFRIKAEGHPVVIGVKGLSIEENRAFVSMANNFKSKNLNVPEVLLVSDDEMCYLQEDLGSLSLYDALSEARRTGVYTKEHRKLIRKTIEKLPHFQIEAAKGFDYSVCYPVSVMDARSAMFDLNYFKYNFLKALEVEFHEIRLEDDFLSLANDIQNMSSVNTFVIRDFQARNVMLSGRDLEPFFIDFQGGRRGPVLYDLVSFLWQAASNYPSDLRQEMIDVYFEALLREYPKFVLPSRLDLDKLVLFRTLQVLGAYGFRGFLQHKSHFLSSIPMAITNLTQCLNKCPYSYLKEVLSNMICKWKRTYPQIQQDGKLHVKVYSFSYKKGIPEDLSGNGGGYVFDCRGTHNPGRYDQYKNLTGIDKPVINFLEENGEIARFLEHVYALIDIHVQRYIERGFTSLMFSFGCTGGQHRSVYSAQHVAEYIHKKFNIRVTLCHREQNIIEEF